MGLELLAVIKSVFTFKKLATVGLAGGDFQSDNVTLRNNS